MIPSFSRLPAALLALALWNAAGAETYANADLLAEAAGRNAALDRLLHSAAGWPLRAVRSAVYGYADLSGVDSWSTDGFYIDLYGLGTGLQGHGFVVARQIQADGRDEIRAAFGLYTTNAAHGEDAVFPPVPEGQTAVALEVYEQGLEAFWGPVPERLIDRLDGGGIFKRVIKVREDVFTATLDAVRAQGSEPRQLTASYILGGFQLDWRSLFQPVLAAARTHSFEIWIPRGVSEHQDSNGRTRLRLDMDKRSVPAGAGFDLAGEQRFLFPNVFIQLFNIGHYLDRTDDVSVLNTAAAGARDTVESAAVEGDSAGRHYGWIEYAYMRDRVAGWAFPGQLHRYEGEMTCGVPDGTGVLYLAGVLQGDVPWGAQRRYIGGFENGKPHGYGAIFAGADQMIAEGRFVHGLLGDWIAFYNARGDLTLEESLVDGVWRYVEYKYDYYDLMSRAPRFMRKGVIEDRPGRTGVSRQGRPTGDWQFVPRKVVLPSSACVQANGNYAGGCPRYHLFINEHDAVYAFPDGRILRGAFGGANGVYDFSGQVTVSYSSGNRVTGLYDPEASYPTGPVVFYRAADDKTFPDAVITQGPDRRTVELSYVEMVWVEKKNFLDYATAPFDWIGELISPVADPVIDEMNRFVERDEGLKKFLDSVCKGELCKAEYSIDWDDHSLHELPDHLRLAAVEDDGYGQTVRRDPAGNMFPVTRMADNGSLTSMIALPSPVVTAGTDHAGKAYVRAVGRSGILVDHALLALSLIRLKSMHDEINADEQRLRLQLSPGETRRYLGVVNRHNLQWSGFNPLPDGAGTAVLSPDEIPVYREMTNLSRPLPFSREEATQALRAVQEWQERQRKKQPIP